MLQNETQYDAPMKAIILRNLPPQLERKVQEKARELRLSLSKTVARLLEECLLPSARPLGGRRYRDLDHLAGSWRSDEADDFDASLDEQRWIDQELSRTGGAEPSSTGA